MRKFISVVWNPVSKFFLAAATHDVASVVIGWQVAYHSWHAYYEDKLTDENLAKGAGQCQDNWLLNFFDITDDHNKMKFGVLGIGLTWNLELE